MVLACFTIYSSVVLFERKYKMSFAPTSLPKPPAIACDGGGFVVHTKPPKGACDGDGLVSKVELPKDVYAPRGIIDKVGTIGTSSETIEASKKSSKTKTAIGAAVLLIGGAILGYGHRDVISKGLNSVKESVTKFFATGKAAELLEQGKNALGKVKDTIMSKKLKIVGEYNKKQ